MLINQWADQYQGSDGAKFAAHVLTAGQFFDFGDDHGFMPGDQMYQATRPPYPNVVAQLMPEVREQPMPLLVFFLQYGPDQFQVGVAHRDRAREWWTSRLFLMSRSVNDKWALSQLADSNPTGDDCGGTVAEERELVRVGMSRALATFAVLACTNVRERAGAFGGPEQEADEGGQASPGDL
jgi:hypothetical protein